jgi:hypothetical protein
LLFSPQEKRKKPFRVREHTPTAQKAAIFHILSFFFFPEKEFLIFVQMIFF